MRRPHRSCNTPPMDITLRPVTQAELDDFRRATGIAFGNIGGGDDDFAWGPGLDVERSLAGFDGDQIVATAAALSFELTVPGHALVPTAGVTMVGVRPTHRRQGLLVRMMEEQLADVAARSEPLAVLTASETAIYGRFGYGLATFSSFWSLRTEGTTFARPSTAGGQFRLLDPATGPHGRSSDLRRGAQAARRRGDPQRPVVRAHVRQPARRQAPALVHRGARIRRRARRRLRPLPRQGRLAGRDRRQHGRGRRPVRARSRGRDRALAVPRRHRPRRDRAGHQSADGRIGAVAPRRSPPSPGRPGRPTTSGYASSIPRSRSAARTYSSDDHLVVELTDPFLPANEGRWSIAGSGDGAEVRRTDADADLALSAPELGALYLGGVSATTLQRADRITELVPGAIERADRFFASTPAPWCGTDF